MGSRILRQTVYVLGVCLIMTTNVRANFLTDFYNTYSSRHAQGTEKLSTFLMNCFDIYVGDVSQTFEMRAFIREIYAVSQDYGLFFIFKSSCPDSHKFAPIVQNFARRFDFELQGISEDGQGIEGFDSFLFDNGIGSALNPQGNTPCLVLVNKHTKITILLANSNLNREQLMKNMNHIIQHLKTLQNKTTINNQG